MMGSRDRQKQLWSYRVNLDKRVRSDHPLRKFNELLELDFVREEVANFYGTKGNVSKDPAVIMKMMLLLFLDKVRTAFRRGSEEFQYTGVLSQGIITAKAVDWKMTIRPCLISMPWRMMRLTKPTVASSSNGWPIEVALWT